MTIIVHRHDVINKNKELTKLRQGKSYKIKPCTNERPKRCACTSREEENLERLTYTAVGLAQYGQKKLKK